MQELVTSQLPSKHTNTSTSEFALVARASNLRRELGETLCAALSEVLPLPAPTNCLSALTAGGEVCLAGATLDVLPTVSKKQNLGAPSASAHRNIYCDLSVCLVGF